MAQIVSHNPASVHAPSSGYSMGLELSQHRQLLFISGQVSRARTAQTVAIGSMPKPYSAPDMVMAVAYLLARIRGDETQPRPGGLEVFDPGADLAPAA